MCHLKIVAIFCDKSSEFCHFASKFMWVPQTFQENLQRFEKKVSAEFCAPSTYTKLFALPFEDGWTEGCVRISQVDLCVSAEQSSDSVGRKDHGFADLRISVCVTQFAPSTTLQDGSNKNIPSSLQGWTLGPGRPPLPSLATGLHLNHDHAGPPR